MLILIIMKINAIKLKKIQLKFNNRSIAVGIGIYIYTVLGSYILHATWVTQRSHTSLPLSMSSPTIIA